MAGVKFVDTNVLIYAAASDPAEEFKRARSRELLGQPDIAVSVQVLQEFYYQATHNRRSNRLSHEAALRFLEPVMELPIQELTLPLFREATAIRHRFAISLWDSAILAAARALGCETIYSEDLNSQQDYGGIRVQNPFNNNPAPE